MVATRNHPQPFEETVNESPTKRITRSAANHTSPSKPLATTPPTLSRARGASSRGGAASSSDDEPEVEEEVVVVAGSGRAGGDGWAHTPSKLTLLWLAISLPLVIWDTGYVLLRPHSMPNGWLHAPLWTPYELYGRIDHVYGLPAWEARDGWTAAQGFVNALETAAYLVYLAIVYRYGRDDAARKGRGAPDLDTLGQGPLRTLAESRTLVGRWAAVATVLCFSTALVTFWKTVLYWLIEAFSGFRSIGHNDFSTLLFLWIIPNGAWLVFPAYMIYVFGAEIVEGLEIASNGTKKTQ